MYKMIATGTFGQNIILNSAIKQIYIYWAALSLSFRRIFMNIIAWGPQVNLHALVFQNMKLLFTFEFVAIISISITITYIPFQAAKAVKHLLRGFLRTKLGI